MSINTSPHAAPFGAVIRPGALTGPALQALGLIRYADDPGAEGTGQEAQQQAQGGTGAPAGAPTPLELQQAQERAAQQQQDPAEGNIEELPEWARKALTRANNDAAKYRTEKSAEVQRVQQEADARVKAMLKAAGIDTGDETDPEKLAQQAAEAREAAEREAKEARLELAVYRAAADPAVKADPVALLDSRKFLQRTADIDPTDTAAITAAIRETIQENPKLAATQVVPRSSGDFTGGSGEGAVTLEKFKAMSNSDKANLFKTDPATFRSLADQL